MIKKYKVFFLGCILLILDQCTKYLFFTQSTFSDWIIFEPAFNTGISWSVQIPALIVILIAAISLGIFIVAYKKKYFNRVVLSFLLAGTLGNMLDRIYLGGVRDFIYVGSRFPIFNVADVYLNAGVFLYLFSEFFTGKKKSKS